MIAVDSWSSCKYYLNEDEEKLFIERELSFNSIDIENKISHSIVLLKKIQHTLEIEKT